MAERDPAKRAKLLREAERGSLAGLNTTRPSTKASTQPRSTAGGAEAASGDRPGRTAADGPIPLRG